LIDIGLLVLGKTFEDFFSTINIKSSLPFYPTSSTVEASLTKDSLDMDVHEMRAILSQACRPKDVISCNANPNLEVPDDLCEVYRNVNIFHLVQLLGEESQLGLNQYIDTYRYLPTRRYTIQLQVDISIEARSIMWVLK
jgi:hypothetical protein